MADERKAEDMKDCFGTGMLWWVPVKEGISNPEKQKECYTCPDLQICTQVHTAHHLRHLSEITLHYVKTQAAKSAASS